MNWEIGMDMHTRICIKWITNKNLLYKKIHKIKFKKKKKSQTTRITSMCEPAGGPRQADEAMDDAVPGGWGWCSFQTFPLGAACARPQARSGAEVQSIQMACGR